MPRNNKDKLRIAMLGHKRIPSREGGVEIVVEQLATRMSLLGHSLTVYNRKGHHVSGAKYDSTAKNIYKGVRIKSVPTIEKRGLAAMSASFFAAISAAFSRYDVVHFHAEGPCAMLWLPKLFGKKCIATIHGLDHQRAKWGKFASRYILFGEKCAVKFADEIIVLSKNVQDYFLKNYGRETIFIPNGITASKNVEAKEIAEKFGLKKDEYILYLGRLVNEKGIDYLIDAYKGVKTDKKLVIAGGSSDTKDYEQHLKDKAADCENIIFTGFVQGRLLEELYSNAYLYVLPSDLEGMPLSLLEAMSYSNCCLTSNIPECVQVTGECGVSFEKSNTEDLLIKMQMLCDNADFVNKYKNTAAQYVCERFNWDEITEKTLNLYSKKSKASKEERYEDIVHK